MKKRMSEAVADVDGDKLEIERSVRGEMRAVMFHNGEETGALLWVTPKQRVVLRAFLCNAIALLDGESV